MYISSPINKDLILTKEFKGSPALSRYLQVYFLVSDLISHTAAERLHTQVSNSYQFIPW